MWDTLAESLLTFWIAVQKLHSCEMKSKIKEPLELHNLPTMN